MLDGSEFAALALSFPGTEEKAHFDRIGFRIIGKRMFATYLSKENSANVFLTPAEQSVFCQMDPENIFPVPNKWGEKGATTFDLNNVSEDVLREALWSAYNEILKK